MKGLGIRKRIRNESTRAADWIKFTENRYGTEEERQKVVSLAIKRDQGKNLGRYNRWLLVA